MPLDEKVIEEVKHFLPQSLWPLAYIAGGYAHNPELAGDVDVWVLSTEFSDEQTTADLMRGHLLSVGEYPQLELMPPYDGNDRQPDRRFVVVKNLPRFPGPDIQLLTAAAKTVNHLVESFDITTHKIARPLLNPTSFYVGEGYFPLGLEPRVTRWDTPDQTMQRLKRIAKRYGFEPNAKDLAQLEDAAEAEMLLREFGKVAA